MNFRFAKPEDATALLNIYAQYIDTSITFEYDLPTEAIFSGRIAHISQDYPYLVCEEKGKIIGYAYAHRHMERAAYQWNAELSVYLDQARTSKGLGKTFYLLLIEILKLQNIKTVYGCVTLPNIRSESLHNSLGFHVVGTYHNAGFKAGEWHDVIWFEKSIAPYHLTPQPLISIRAIPPEQLQAILMAHNAFICDSTH